VAVAARRATTAEEVPNAVSLAAADGNLAAGSAKSQARTNR